MFTRKNIHMTDTEKWFDKYNKLKEKVNRITEEENQLEYMQNRIDDWNSDYDVQE